MKDRRKREVLSWNKFFIWTIFMVFSCVLFTGFTFSTFRIFREAFHPVLVPPWRNSAIKAVSEEESPISPVIEIRETIIFPDQVLILLKYPPSTPLFTKDDLDCNYIPPNSSTQPNLNLPPSWIDDNTDLNQQFIRCPIHPRGFTTSISLKSNGRLFLPKGPAHSWDSLVYESIIDRDNTTIVFVKGLNLRPERLGESSKYECVYGWDISKPKLLLTSEVISVAQEIVRCNTPLSVLSSLEKSVKVSVRVKGRGILGILRSVARPNYLPEADKLAGQKHEMCVCTMVRNQARFLREWVMYHSRIGVERWFIYDNNSEDPIDEVIGSLYGSGYNITRHYWPWIKTQEAGFAHCALRARDSCEWVGFFDVDEFLYFRSNMNLHDVIRNETTGFDQIGELRVPCYSFGPSGLKRAPEQGVTVGYTCRLTSPERHKSIVRPQVLNSTLINVVHHFHVRNGFGYINVDRGVMVINHYKYQVWEVFKEKFYRRVATFVADWQNKENVGSKDRTPGLGTRAVEPSDWSSRFCEVRDTGIRDWVLRVLADPNTNRLPWQDNEDNPLINEE